MKVFNYNLIALILQNVAYQPKLSDITDVELSSLTIEETFDIIRGYSNNLGKMNIVDSIKFFISVGVKNPIIDLLTKEMENGFALMDYSGNHVHLINVPSDVEAINIQGVKIVLDETSKINLKANNVATQFVPINYQILRGGITELLVMNGDGFEYDLGEKTFLTNFLDGSDKIYGFVVKDAENKEIGVTNGGVGFDFEDMDDEDTDYLYTSIGDSKSIYEDLVNRTIYG